MTIILRLKHVWGGAVSSPTANPILLAMQDAGLRGARQVARDLVKVNDKIVTLPFKQADYLRRLAVNYADRIEALPVDVLKALGAEANRLAKRDAKLGTFTAIRPDYPLYSFNLDV